MEIADTDASGNIIRRYVPGAGVDQRFAMITVDAANGTETDRHFYHTNRLGSVIALTDTLGNVTDQYVYTPYGVESPLTGSGNPFRYTGRRYDTQTDLYYYRARYYSAELGRFLETDPIGYQDQMNLYGYVGNDPLNATDPSGKSGLRDLYDVKGEPLPGGLNTEGMTATGSLKGDMMLTVGILIVAFDVLTVPSGEGTMGAAMIKHATAQSAIGAATNIGIDALDGEVDMVNLPTTIKEGAQDGLLGAGIAKQIAGSVKAVRKLDNLDDIAGGDAATKAALEAFEVFVEGPAAQVLGNVGGTVTGQILREKAPVNDEKQ